MMAAPVQAAEQSEQFNIAPGPLAQTLNRFAQQAGVAVIMDQNQIAQQKSKGLQGSFTVSSGFAQLLTGSGFQARETNSGYVIEPATTTEQPSESVTLSTVQVSATGMGNLTEGSRSYTTGSVNSINRLNMSLRETPQTITVVTSQQIKDFGYHQMDDVLRSTSGVYVYNRGLNGGAYLSR
ncbi:STN domain-containing protein, partial [Klebsiella pneumoniae]